MVSTVQTTGETALQAKLKKKSGFTLAELLIVVAIIAILAAIAIPLYTAQMEKARVSVDQSTLSAATSMATSDYLLKGYTGTYHYSIYTSKPTATGDSSGKRNISVAGAATAAPGDGAPLPDGIPTGATLYTPAATKTYSALVLQIGDGGAIVKSEFTKVTK